MLDTARPTLCTTSRVELLISFEAGTYALRTGDGPMTQAPECESTHCELLLQDVMATLEVLRLQYGTCVWG